MCGAFDVVAGRGGTADETLVGNLQEFLRGTIEEEETRVRKSMGWMTWTRARNTWILDGSRWCIRSTAGVRGAWSGTSREGRRSILQDMEALERDLAEEHATRGGHARRFKGEDDIHRGVSDQG